jgi:hydrogenase-4 component F
MMLLSLLLIPLAAAGLIAMTRRRALIELLHAVAAMATLGAGAVIAARVWSGAVLTAIGDLFRVDALSALMVAIITFLGAIAALYAVGYIRAQLDETQLSRGRLFFALFHLLFFTMLVADDG